MQDQIVPRLVSAMPNAVSFIGSEDAEELVADGTLFAAKMIHSAEQAGKKIVKTPGARGGARKVNAIKEVTAGNVAFYTIQKLKSGRRSTGSSVVDVYGSGTQINGTTRLTSLDEPVTNDSQSIEEELTVHDVLSNDHEDPATKAARKMDWDSFMAGLSKREKTMIEFLVNGKTFTQARRKLNVSYSTIQGSKRDLAVKLLDFMGSDILIQVNRQPRWKHDLQTIRERLECREQRRHL